VRTILIDFDGVIHSYVSEWQGKTTIPDPPIPGAITALKDYVRHPNIRPAIWTSRVHCGENEDPNLAEHAKQAIRAWLIKYGMTVAEVDQIPITNSKPPATLIVDDRAFSFRGDFPTPWFVERFEPWKFSAGENS